MHYDLTEAAARSQKLSGYDPTKCYAIFFQTWQYVWVSKAVHNEPATTKSVVPKKIGRKRAGILVEQFTPALTRKNPEITRQLSKKGSKGEALLEALDLAEAEIKTLEAHRLAWRKRSRLYPDSQVRKAGTEDNSAMIIRTAGRVPGVGANGDVFLPSDEPTLAFSINEDEKLEQSSSRRESTAYSAAPCLAMKVPNELPPAKKARPNGKCAECGRTDCDESKNAARCEQCQKLYHLACWGGPEIKKAPLTLKSGKKWYCADCLACDRCGRTQRACGPRNRVARPRLEVVNRHGEFFLPSGLLRAPSGATFVRPSGGGYLCRECLDNYKTGKLCATCHEPWTEEDSQMIKCDGPGCRLWSHASCDGIDQEAYKMIGDGTHPMFGLEFLCAAGCAAKVATRIVTKLSQLDDLQLFARPVDSTIAPTYCDVIKHPMDLSTMRTKAEAGFYRSTQAVRNDAELMCANAVTFNRPGDRFWREACRFFDAATKVFDAKDVNRGAQEQAQPEACAVKKVKEPDQYSKQFHKKHRRVLSPALVPPEGVRSVQEGPNPIKRTLPEPTRVQQVALQTEHVEPAVEKARLQQDLMNPAQAHRDLPPELPESAREQPASMELATVQHVTEQNATVQPAQAPSPVQAQQGPMPISLAPQTLEQTKSLLAGFGEQRDPTTKYDVHGPFPESSSPHVSDSEHGRQEDNGARTAQIHRKSTPSNYAEIVRQIREVHYCKLAKDKASREATVRKDALAGTAVKRVERVERVPCVDPASCVAVAEVRLDQASALLVHAWFDVCLVCGSGEAVTVSDSAAEYDGPPGGELLTCVDCGEAFHGFCAFAPSATMDAAAKLTWRCPNCKLCELCGLCKQEDESRLVYCDVCDKAYHLDCLEPPLDAAPPGRWICGLCVECKYCTANAQSSLRLRWSSRRDACAGCLEKSRLDASRAPLSGKCAALEACLLGRGSNETPYRSCAFCAARFHEDCAMVFLQPTGDADDRACLRCISQTTGDVFPTHLGTGAEAWRCVVACARAQRKRSQAKRRGSRESEEQRQRPILRGWTAFFKSWGTPRAHALHKELRRVFGSDWIDSRACALCKRRGDCVDAGRLVPTHDDKNSWVHLNCARWSSEVYEVDRSIVKVRNAIARSRTLRCSKCNLPGATMGCCAQSCRTNYHFRCGAMDGAVCIDGVRVLCNRCFLAKMSIRGHVEENEDEQQFESDDVASKPNEDADKQRCVRAITAGHTDDLYVLQQNLHAAKEHPASESFSGAASPDPPALDESQDSVEKANTGTSVPLDDVEDYSEDFDEEDNVVQDQSKPDPTQRTSRVSAHMGDVAASLVVPSALDFEIAGCKHDAYEYFVKRRAKEVSEAAEVPLEEGTSSVVGKKKPSAKKPKAATKADDNQQPTPEQMTPDHVKWLDNRVLRARELGDVFRIGALVVHNLGCIAPAGYRFHSRDRIYPMGYRASRIFWSAVRPATRVVYMCEIINGAAENDSGDTRCGEISHFPLFRITALDDPDTTYSSILDPRRAVAKLHRAVERCNRLAFGTRIDGGHFSPRHHFRSYGLGEDGAGFFGISIPAVRARIEDLQNAVTAALTIKPLYSEKVLLELLQSEDSKDEDDRLLNNESNKAKRDRLLKSEHDKPNHSGTLLSAPIKQESLASPRTSQADVHEGGHRQSHELVPVRHYQQRESQFPQLQLQPSNFPGLLVPTPAPTGLPVWLGSCGPLRLALDKETCSPALTNGAHHAACGSTPTTHPSSRPQLPTVSSQVNQLRPHLLALSNSLENKTSPQTPASTSQVKTEGDLDRNAGKPQGSPDASSSKIITTEASASQRGTTVSDAFPVRKKRPLSTPNDDGDRSADANHNRPSKRQSNASKGSASRHSSRSAKRPSAMIKYSFCYVQPSVGDVLGAQRQVALRDAAVRPNPSGCARAEPHDKTDEAYRARITRSLVRGADESKNEEIPMAPQSQAKVAVDDSLPANPSPFSGVLSALNENRNKYRRMKAVPMQERLEVRRSHIHGWGLFLKRDVRKDEFIVEYVGQIVRQVVGDKREKYYDKAGYGSCYLFRLDNDRIVDATRRGNVGRFINHCCKPNAYARVVNVEAHVKKIVIIALFDLRAGDEVMYDYKFPIEDDKVRCFCGAPTCRGYMN